MDASSAHHQSLRERHQQLERAIHEEQSRRAPDDIRIHEMKKQKLHIKEQLEGLVHS